MGPVEIVAAAASLSLLAGWRLYAAVLALGLVVRFGGMELPPGTDVFGSWWVIGVAGMGALAEFLADKVALVDSLWDAVHTLVRPVGGALLALAVVQPDQPEWGVVTLLLGGGAALAAHGAKAGVRAVVNTSPEPFSNVGVSLVEDGLVAGGLWLLWAHPEWAVGLAVALAALTVVLLVVAWRVVRRVWR